MCGTCFHLAGQWFRAPLSEFNGNLRPGISLAYERLKITEPEPAFVYEQSHSLIIKLCISAGLPLKAFSTQKRSHEVGFWGLQSDGLKSSKLSRASRL
jgi:hypothetical protein